MLAVSCRATVNGALGFAISDIGAELARHPHPDTVSRVLSFANSHRLIGIRDDSSRHTATGCGCVLNVYWSDKVDPDTDASALTMRILAARNALMQRTMRASSNA